MYKTPKGKLSDEEYVAQRLALFDDFKDKLEQSYWPNFKVNKEMYAGYDPNKPDRYHTNTARGMVESTVNKVVTANRKVTADIHGPIPAYNKKIEQTLGSLAESIFDDKKLAKRHGTYRANKEKLVRDLLTIGNCVGEKNYEYLTTETDEGTTRVLADGVYISPLAYDQYIFNVAQTWNTSSDKFIRKTASFDDLKDAEEKEVDDTDEANEPEDTVQTPSDIDRDDMDAEAKPKKKSGLYKNLDKLEQICADKGKLKQWQPEQGGYDPYSGTNFIAPRWVEDIDIKVSWEGCYLCVIAEDSIIIREEYDPFGTGTDNVTTAMLIEETGRPVGWGVIDHIRGLVQIKDDSLNQRKALLERVLKVGGLYDDTDPAKLRMIAQVILKGGVAPGKGEKWKEINIINPGIASALLSPAEIQAEIERSSLYSPYSSGQLSQETDKTAGTASGIKSLQSAAAPNDETVLDKVEEQIDTPFLNFALQAIANASSENDIRFVMRAGGSSDSVAITKRFLQGRPTMDDLLQAGVMTQEEAQNYTQHNPQLAQEPYVDAEWIISVSLDPSNASDKYQKAQAKKAMVDELINFQQPVDIKKAYTDIAMEMGYDDFGEIFLDEKKVAEQNKAKEEEQQKAMDQQKQMAQADHQRKIELLQASQQHEVALEHARTDATPGLPATAKPEQPQHPVQKIAESMNFKDIPFQAQNAMLEMAGLPATAKPLPAPVKAAPLAKKPLPVA